MHTLASLPLVGLLALTPSVLAKTYHKTKDYTAHGAASFFDAFDFFNAPDPTHGTVQYVDRATALSTQLLDPAASSSIYIGVDTTTMLSGVPGAPGRRAVRIESKAIFSPGTLLVADIAHAPAGCGVWPALWLRGADPWPTAGELDIFEQVNLARANSVTLHTTEGCALRNEGTAYSGSIIFPDCNSAHGANGNRGCGIAVLGEHGGASFGAGFNANGGGVYVAEWKRHGGFNVWFFPRGATPAVLASHKDEDEHGDAHEQINTEKLGKPSAAFYGEGCPWHSHFRDMRIVINTSLCGDWAGEASEWAGSGCAAVSGGAPCDSFVRNNPRAFQEAFWRIKSLRVFERREREIHGDGDGGAGRGQRVMGAGAGAGAGGESWLASEL